MERWSLWGGALMPRGTRRDLAVTKMLHENGLLLEKDSFASHDAHLYLVGQDKSIQRARVFEKTKGICFKCGRFCSWEEGEWHHLKSGLVGRCDCLHNAAWACGRFVSNCHTSEHVQVQRVRLSPKECEN